MAATADEVRDIVRQLRAELDWAMKTGIVPVAFSAPVPAPAPSPAPVVVPVVERAPPPVLVPATAPTGSTLEAIREDLGDCTRCKLSGLGRKQIVFGAGNPRAELMFIGEAPGAEEDQRGEPFVGEAGRLLTKMIEGMGFTRGDVYIANILKCRPPHNRDPQPDEVEQCEPFLKRQIDVIRPRALVALGKYAAQTLLRVETPITRLRGQWKVYNGIDLMPTFHPAYLLRNPSDKRQVWDDLKAVLARLGREVPARNPQK